MWWSRAVSKKADNVLYIGMYIRTLNKMQRVPDAKPSMDGRCNAKYGLLTPRVLTFVPHANK